MNKIKQSLQLRKKSLLFIILLLPLTSFGQVPPLMKYQAIIRDASGNPIINTNLGIRISILEGTMDGPAVYVETHATQTSNAGLYQIEIGGGTVISGDFSGINWSSGSYFLKTEVDAAGGTSYTLNGVSQLLTVPYAFYAREAGNGFSGNYNDLHEKPDFSSWDQDAGNDFTGDYNELTNKPVLFNGSWSSLTGKPNFANIATTGSYNDLLNKPAAWDSSYLSLKSKPDFSVYATKNMNNQKITNLATPVSNQDAANKAYVDLLQAKIDNLIQIMASNGLRTIMDADGNTYLEVKIGTQKWMGENLRTTHYRNGDPIPNVTANGTWQTQTGGAYCWYNNDQGNSNGFGALYNFYTTIDSRNLCPSGYHVPTDVEWQTLEVYLGIPTFDANFVGWRGVDEGGQLKEVDNTYWDDASTASNTSGFSARGGGKRQANGAYTELLFTGGWWTSSSYSTTMAWYREIFSYNENITRYYDLKTQGRSVRCLKD
jgi:uncharacterized protein (TIGR02145 family)